MIVFRSNQVISIRSAGGGLSQYYVHYVDYNKRLDEWVTEERLDTRRITPPAKGPLLYDVYTLMGERGAFFF